MFITDTNKTLAWCFPFKRAGAQSREVADPQICYDALAKATGGTYPLGQGGLWHGGVHFDKNTAELLDQKAVRCIADGEVIAYRIDQAYPTAPKANGEPATYSTGFVLVKHDLSLPGEPHSAIAPLPPPSLTFYSLYMHLLSWERYQREPDRARPVFWIGEPQTKGQVIVLDTPFAIKSRELIGHPGTFSTPSHADGEGLLHLEIFSCDDVPAFIEKSRAYAARLPESARGLVGISTIASALAPHTAQINAANPPKMAMRSLRTLPGLILPRAVLDNRSNERWIEEKKRIRKLSWWAELAGKHGINPNGKAWHFHPIGLLANFVAIEDENDLKWLTVERGQLTFDVEGNDIDDPAHPLHIYFSRKVHWPGGASGITIGRGYDLGQRENVELDLTAANIDEPLYSWLIGAKGLKGQAAKNHLKTASTEIKRFTISRKQQHDLFIPVYEKMKNDVLRISAQEFNVFHYGALKWNSIDKKIQDLIVDLTYRGDYSTHSRPLIQKHFVNNDLSKLTDIMSDSSNWQNVPSDRFNRRIGHLTR